MKSASRPGAVQTISVAATSAAVSNAFGAQTYQVRLASTVACYYTVEATPVATTSDNYLPANWVEYITVTPGQKIAAIRASADGTMTVTEVS